MAIVEQWNEPGDVGSILAFPRGLQDVRLEVYFADEHNNFDGLSLQFRVDSVADFLAALPGEIGFEGPTDRPWGSTYVYLRDPNNIRVIVYEGGL